jgi:hypothetical protein
MDWFLLINGSTHSYHVKLKISALCFFAMLMKAAIPACMM